MKCIAAIWVDLDRGPLDTRSRLADDLMGKPVLRRTAERVSRCKAIAGVHLLCPVAQSVRVKQLVDGLKVNVESHDAAPPPYASLVRAGRAWGLDSWRGGIGGLTVFDEDFHADAVRTLTERQNADAVVSLAAAAALIDPLLIDALVAHYETYVDSARMTFVQAPPGLAAIVLGRELLSQLAPTGQPPGVLMTYHPDRPLADLTGKEACYRPSAHVIHANGRLLADTRRGFDRLRDLIEAGGENWDAAQIARWLLLRESPMRQSLVRESVLAPTTPGIPSRDYIAEPIPAEIEIELTTEDLLPNTLLRPRGREVGQRGPIRLSVIHDVVEAIKDYDDVRIVLGGFGDPCLHPAFAEICAALRPSTALPIAVRTPAFFPSDSPRMGDASEAALFDTPIDAVEVMLDAATSETYQRVHRVDAFEQVLARVERWITLREQRHQVRPLIVPSFIKARENLDDMEAFFDLWQRRLGTALITGYSHCAGQRSDRAVTDMVPPQREPCSRVRSRALVLADGRMTTCDQDFNGRQSLGLVGQESFASLWKSQRLEQIRSNELDGLPLCPQCTEWHRP